MVGMWVLGGLITMALIVLVGVWMAMRKRGLSDKERKKLQEVWMLAEAIDDPVRKLIEGDKVVHTALKMLGFQGSMGDALKAAGPKFTNRDAVWRAHKLRNIVAHELNHHPADGDVSRAMSAFRQALRDLGV